MLAFTGMPGPIELLILVVLCLVPVVAAIAVIVSIFLERKMEPPGAKMTPCPDCGHPMPPGEKQCPNCGCAVWK